MHQGGDLGAADVCLSGAEGQSNVEVGDGSESRRAASMSVTADNESVVEHQMFFNIFVKYKPPPGESTRQTTLCCTGDRQSIPLFRVERRAG